LQEAFMFHSRPSPCGPSHPQPRAGSGSPLPDYESFEKLLRLVYLKPLRVNGGSRLSGYLALYLPEVAARIGYDDLGVLHLEIGVLKLAVREAIADRDWSAVNRYFGQVASMLEDAGPELFDAIAISLLGSLFYGETALNLQKARTLLPEPLRLALDIVERHYGDIGT
jgi:hypothetical protein